LGQETGAQEVGTAGAPRILQQELDDAASVQELPTVRRAPRRRSCEPRRPCAWPSRRRPSRASFVWGADEGPHSLVCFAKRCVLSPEVGLSLAKPDRALGAAQHLVADVAQGSALVLLTAVWARLAEVVGSSPLGSVMVGQCGIQG